MKIIAAHLYNDYSGSPLVLAQLLRHWIKQGKKVVLFTSSHTGRLSGIEGVNYFLYSYTWSKNKVLTLFRFFKTNIYIFIKILFLSKKGDIVYVNTLLPFGAAIAGKLKKATVVYHVHETSVQPESFKNFLKFIQKTTADKSVYVSNYLLQQEGMGNEEREFVVYNALSLDFINKAEHCINRGDKKREDVLMLASLRAYKGIEEFFQLAKRLPQIPFTLVLNATEQEVENYLETHPKPDNLSIFSSVENVHPFYAKAKIVVNLSRPDQWAETFGMTSIEALKYGVPVIFPPVGGPVEVVKPEFGFLISCYWLEEIANVIEMLYQNPSVYNSKAQNALDASKAFYPDKFVSGIDRVLFKS